jgi:hypothetical protein
VSYRPRFPLIAVLAVFALATPGLKGAEGGAVTLAPAAPSLIFVGFVGGFIRHDNPHHAPVQFAKRLRENFPKGAYIEVFENRHRRAAYNKILQLLDRDHDGALSDVEKSQAHVVLFGQSWGGSAVVLLARQLNHIGVPVLLTVQVDSIAKLWQKDGVIPENVAAAANFYQPHGLLHGRAQIVAADPARTEILGNYRFDYRENPIRCEGMPWTYRVLTPGHMQTDCDPRLWGQIENIVRTRIGLDHSIVASAPIGDNRESSVTKPR